MLDEFDKIKIKEIIHLEINEFTTLNKLIEFVDYCEIYHLYDKLGNRYYTAKKLIREKEIYAFK